MQIYTNGTHLYQAQAMTNVEFFMLDEDYQAENLTGLVVQEGYLVKHQDEQIQMTSWYPKAVFEKNFTLVNEFVNKILQLQSKNSWISIDDYLPPNGSECFVLREKIDISKFSSYIPAPIEFMNSYYCRVDKTIYKDDHFICDEKSREKVTHWVLMPQPPKE